MEYDRKKLIFRIAALLLCVLLLPIRLPVYADSAPILFSYAGVLLDAETGQVLYAKNMHQRMYPASITKIMTGLLAVRSLQPEQLLTVSKAAYRAVPRTSSHVSLIPGEQLTAEQALYALAIESANDAANVLGEAVSGDLTAFAQLMTETAESLGAKNTHFANANGLPHDEHYTTAYDMALIAAEAIQEPEFLKYFSAVHYTLGATNLNLARKFSSKNRFLNGEDACEGVLMSKTGWTTAAQGTLVTAARRGDTTLIAVVMKSMMTENKYQDTQKLFQYGFSHYYRAEITGEDAAAKLNTGAYTPAPGQKHLVDLPVGITVDDLSFTLAEGMELESGEAEQTAVIVHAALGEEALPDMAFVMLRTPPETVPEPKPTEPEEAQPELAVPELISEAPQSAAVPTQMLVMGGIAVITVLLLGEQHHRRVERQHRRRQLEGKIRQMKRRMEE